MNQRNDCSEPATDNVVAVPVPEPRIDAETRALQELLTEFLPYLKAHLMEVAFAGPLRARLDGLPDDVEVQTGPDELRATGDEVLVAGVDLALQMEQVVEVLSMRLEASAANRERAN